MITAMQARDNTTTLSPAPVGGSLEASRMRLEHRIGLNIPYEWWPGPATLKAIEAAGFRWVPEIRPAHRPGATTLWDLGISVLGGREAPRQVRRRTPATVH
jgi:hypothetical protein